jgi:excisionase family DNA binding protein
MEELLTVTELAGMLKVSPWTIRAWCSQKYIPYFKLRGSVRFRTSEIDQWLKKNSSPGRSLHRLKIEQSAN